LKYLLEKYSGHLSNPGKPTPLQAGGPHSSVQEQVYEKIRDAILSGILEPGQRLLQDELAAELAVDRAPVREALLRLEAENIVDFHPYKGFTVAFFTLDDLKEIYFLRGLLEGTASRLAAKNLTDEDLDQLQNLCGRMEKCLDDDDLSEMPRLNTSFHEIIYSSAKSPRLSKMIARLWNGFLKSSIGFLTLRAPVMVQEHKSIYEALRKRDPDEAEARVRSHLESALNDLEEYWSHRLIVSEEK